MTWYGAFAHCRRLNSTLLKGSFPKNVLFTAAHNVVRSSFWTGKLYQTIIDIPHTDWIWPNGSVFNEWSRWNIIIDDIGCGGCSFWKNGMVHLTSKCSQNVSYFCGSDWIGKYATLIVQVYTIE